MYTGSSLENSYRIFCKGIFHLVHQSQSNLTLPSPWHTFLPTGARSKKQK
ncbi:rCG57387 [Rattus norvegicus]|uniref:RCG57387 n=1 Tax=Rattus norvegicus TaxID=10116 RepID=A6JP80_RAT|nr:rCG57387 [Rattus norvegicus]